MKTRQSLILIAMSLLFFVWPTLGFSQAHQQDESNSPQDWAHTFNSVIHVLGAEKIVLSYIETCKTVTSIQPRINVGKENWYKTNKQYVDASKWAVDYYGFTIERKSGRDESVKFIRDIEASSEKVASDLITRINDASKSVEKGDLCLMFFDPAGPFIGDLSIHKVYSKYIIKIRDMHQEYLKAMTNQ